MAIQKRQNRIVPRSLKNPAVKTVSLYPPAWGAFFDNHLSQWVKDHYSPNKSWIGKPFKAEDVFFFSKGIKELSSSFTEERESKLKGKGGDYLHHARFRSAYYLYFFPLQAAKFFWVLENTFQKDPSLKESLKKRLKEETPLEIVDLASGPGTATFAFLIWISEKANQLSLPAPVVHITWVDHNFKILKDGEALLEELLKSQENPLDTKLSFKKISWQKSLAQLPQKLDAVFLGNALNEEPGKKTENLTAIKEIYRRTSTFGILLLEPASAGVSQNLSQIRDELLLSEEISQSGFPIWGPCLHIKSCPLSSGRDWCHFSVPAQVPGKWFRAFSRALGSEREWLKFSYLWLAAPDSSASVPKKDDRRVVSDPIPVKKGLTQKFVLLCEPERAQRLNVSPQSSLQRGQIMSLSEKVPQKSHPQKVHPEAEKASFSQASDRPRMDSRAKPLPRSSKLSKRSRPKTRRV
jgi:hypothetical protein